MAILHAMSIRKIVRGVVIGLGIFIGLLIVFLLLVIGPVDTTPLDEFDADEKMAAKLDSVRTGYDPSRGDTTILAGYGISNLTPSFKTATAGYGNRRSKPYTSVLDSLYVRSVVLDNGSQRVAIVSADLSMANMKKTW
jgi:neutral ceramidase